MAEEPLLQTYSIIRVEMGPVFEPVHLEPFVLRCRPHESLEIAARMQALAAPVGSREQRDPHLRPVRHPRLPVLVAVQLVRQAILVKVAPVCPELLFGQGDRAGDPISRHSTLEPTRAAAVLYRVDLCPRPIVGEAVAENSTVMRHVAVEVGGRLPGAD